MKIAFIGMMGTGKSATGKVVAERLGLKFADLDDMIVQRAGMPIAQVFIAVGENVFRSYESDVLQEVYWNEDIVVACGGGVQLKADNMDLLSDYIKVRLTASPEVIYERIKDDFSRPLIKDNSPPALAKIIEEREERYASYADITVDTSGKSIEETAEEILGKLLSIK